MRSQQPCHAAYIIAAIKNSLRNKRCLHERWNSAKKRGILDDILRTIFVCHLDMFPWERPANQRFLRCWPSMINDVNTTECSVDKLWWCFAENGAGGHLWLFYNGKRQKTCGFDVSRCKMTVWRSNFDELKSSPKRLEHDDRTRMHTNW